MASIFTKIAANLVVSTINLAASIFTAVKFGGAAAAAVGVTAGAGVVAIKIGIFFGVGMAVGYVTGKIIGWCGWDVTMNDIVDHFAEEPAVATVVTPSAAAPSAA